MTLALTQNFYSVESHLETMIRTNLKTLLEPGHVSTSDTVAHIQEPLMLSLTWGGGVHFMYNSMLQNK